LAHTAHSDSQPSGHVLNPVLLLVACIWGAGNLMTKWMLEVLEPHALLGLRMGIVTVLMSALLIARPRRRIAWPDLLMLVLLGGGLVTAQLLSFTHAMKMTTASEGSLLISTAPAWTAVMVTLLGMERLSGLNWMGVALASCGVAMIVFGATDQTVGNAPARLPGDLLMLGSAWLYGGYMVLSKRWMQRLGALHVICLTFAASGAMLAVLGSRHLAATDWSTITAGRWAGILYLGVLAGFVGVLLWYRTIGRTSASGTAVYQYLVPGISVLGAALFLGERLAPLQVGGIVVTLAGVHLARLRPTVAALGEGA